MLWPDTSTGAARQVDKLRAKLLTLVRSRVARAYDGNPPRAATPRAATPRKEAARGADGNPGSRILDDPDALPSASQTQQGS